MVYENHDPVVDDPMELLVDQWYELKEAKKRLADEQEEIQWLIIKHMRDNLASELDHPSKEVKLVTKRDYDPSKLQMLKELISPDVLKKGCIPEHEDRVVVPEKWDMRTVKRWDKYGKEVKDIIDNAQYVSSYKLTIQPKTTQK